MSNSHRAKGSTQQMSKHRGKSFVSSRGHLSDEQTENLDTLIKSLVQNVSRVRSVAELTDWLPIFVMADPRGVLVNSSHVFTSVPHIKWDTLGLTREQILDIIRTFNEVCLDYDHNKTNWFSVKCNHDFWVEIRTVMLL